MLLPPIVVVSCQDKFCQLFERFNKSLFQATLFDKMKKKHNKMKKKMYDDNNNKCTYISFLDS